MTRLVDVDLSRILFKVSRSAILKFQAQLDVLTNGIRAAYLVDALQLTPDVLSPLAAQLNHLLILHDLTTSQTFIFNKSLIRQRFVSANDLTNDSTRFVSIQPSLKLIDCPISISNSIQHLGRVIKQAQGANSGEHILVKSFWKDAGIEFEQCSSISAEVEPQTIEDKTQGAWISLTGWLLEYPTVYVQPSIDGGNCLGGEGLWLVRADWKKTTQFMSFSMPASLFSYEEVEYIRQNLYAKLSQRLGGGLKQQDLNVFVQSSVVVLDRVAL